MKSKEVQADHWHKLESKAALCDGESWKQLADPGDPKPLPDPLPEVTTPLRQSDADHFTESLGGSYMKTGKTEGDTFT